MATNFTLTQMIEIIAEGKDYEAMNELGRRFPVLALKIAAVTTKAKDEMVDLAKCFPEHLTANKVNSVVKNSVMIESDEEDADEEVEEKKAPKKEKATKPAKEEAPSGDYNSMKNDELVALIDERGIRDKVEKWNKKEYIRVLEAFDNGDLGDDQTDADEEEDVNPYEGKSAMELFKECKARKIKAAPKKPAKFYIDILIKDDAAKVEVEEDAEDDDWGDDDEEVPAKPVKPAKGKGKGKAKPVEEDDDDDDWDI